MDQLGLDIRDRISFHLLTRLVPLFNQMEADAIRHKNKIGSVFVRDAVHLDFLSRWIRLYPEWRVRVTLASSELLEWAELSNLRRRHLALVDTNNLPAQDDLLELLMTTFTQVEFLATRLTESLTVYVRTERQLEVITKLMQLHPHWPVQIRCANEVVLGKANQIGLEDRAVLFRLLDNPPFPPDASLHYSSSDEGKLVPYSSSTDDDEECKKLKPEPYVAPDTNSEGHSRHQKYVPPDPEYADENQFPATFDAPSLSFSLKMVLLLGLWRVLNPHQH